MNGRTSRVRRSSASDCGAAGAGSARRARICSGVARRSAGTPGSASRSTSRSTTRCPSARISSGVMPSGSVTARTYLNGERLSAQWRGRDPRLAGDLRDPHAELVGEAPAPVLARLQRADDRVLGLSRVPARVLARRAVAAADVAAFQADAQVQPLAALAQAVLAAVGRLRQLGDLDRIQVCAGGHQRAVSSKGSQTWKTVPSGPLSKEIEPRWRSSMMRRQVSRPRPVPAPTSLVVKNGSKILSRFSSGMPGPSSPMSTFTQSPSRLVRIVIVPVSPSAWIALWRMYVHTWLSSDPCIVSFGNVLSYSRTILIFVCLSLWPIITIVDSRPSWMSAEIKPPRSMYAYVLTAPTSVLMRLVLSSSSSARLLAVTDAATQCSALPVTGPAIACTRSSQSLSR